MAQRDNRIADLKQQLQVTYAGALPQISLLRFSGAEKVRVYGPNSMPHHALTLLGLKTSVSVDKNRWGEKEIAIKQLEAISEGYLVYFLPVDEAQVLQSKTWQALPLVQKNRVIVAGKIWSYGGAMSIGRIAESIAKALLQRAP